MTRTSGSVGVRATSWVAFLPGAHEFIHGPTRLLVLGRTWDRSSAAVPFLTTDRRSVNNVLKC